MSKAEREKLDKNEPQLFEGKLNGKQTKIIFNVLEQVADKLRGKNLSGDSKTNIRRNFLATLALSMFTRRMSFKA